MMPPSKAETLRALLDEVATMKAIKEDLPTGNAFMVSQHLQRLEEYLITVLSLEENHPKTAQNDKGNKKRK